MPTCAFAVDSAKFLISTSPLFVAVLFSLPTVTVPALNLASLVEFVTANAPLATAANFPIPAAKIYALAIESNLIGSVTLLFLSPPI